MSHFPTPKFGNCRNSKRSRDVEPSMHEFGDITSPRLLCVKAVLFLVLGLAAGALLIVRSPHLATAVLLAICVWAFARAYYFLFYVIERYIDRSFRFSGIVSALRYLARRGSAKL